LKHSNILQSKPKISVPANGKKGFYTNRVPKKQEVENILVSSGSELCDQDQNKKSNTYFG
jgi:hypothetical protein